jgi:glycosyltransferase involved in cell wall biosynthesis
MAKVSVIIPSYNGAHWIGEAIDSVLDQTHRDTEIIVVSDGSTDETPSVLARYGGRVIHIPQQNGGPAVARNTGIRAATGEYIALLDDDDLWLPDKLEAQLAVLEGDREIGVVFSDYAPFGEPAGYARGLERGPVLRHIPRLPIGPGAYKLPESIFTELLQDLFSWTSTLVVRRDCFDRAGLYDETLRHAAEDWQICLRLSRHCRFAYLDRVLAKRRERGGSLSRQGRDTLEAIRALKNLARREPLTRTERLMVTRKVGDLYRSLGYAAHLRYDTAGARGYFLRSLGCDLALLAGLEKPGKPLASLAYGLSTFLPPRLIRGIRALKNI